MVWSASGWAETWDNAKIKVLYLHMDITCLQTHMGPSDLLPHFSVCSYYGRETCEPPPFFPTFNRLSGKAAKIIWENACSPAWIYSVRPFAVNSLFHSFCLTGEQQESAVYRLFWALALTKVSHMIQENWSISESHLTIHREILKLEQRGKPVDENIT